MESIIQINKQSTEKKDYTIVVITPSQPIPIPIYYQQQLNNNVPSHDGLRQSPYLSSSLLSSSFK